MSIPTVSDVGERELIARVQRRLPPSPGSVRIGIGDDAAVVRPERGTEQVLTTDSLVEGVHFRRDWTKPSAIGHKALAVNLSDIAAMGARPSAALLSLAVPADFPLDDFDGLIDGFVALASRTGTPLVGGNITRSPGPLVVDVTVVGVVRPRRLLQRVGAAQGHWLYVTGQVGAAAAGMGLLAAGIDRASLSAAEAAAVARYEVPEPRLKFSQIVAKTGAASAAIDLSDGLADGAARLAEAANLGVVVDGAAVPVAAGALEWFLRNGDDPLSAAVAAGEDYELAFAVSPRQERRFLAAARRCPDLAVSRIGSFVKERGAWLERDGSRLPLGSAGFSHF